MTCTCPAVESRRRSARAAAAPVWAPIADQFFTHPAPRAMAAVVVVAAAARVVAAARGGGLTWADAVVAAALLLAMPFVEWLVHARVLHARPITWRGRELRSAAARAHAAHHADPHSERLFVTPLPVLLPLLPAIAALGILPSLSLRLTALAVLSLLLLTTEWVHYLAHAPISHKSVWLRRRARAHRLHHYRDDRSWFGLTSGLADAVMHTAPSRDTPA